MIIKYLAPAGLVITSFLTFFYYKKCKQLVRQLQIVSQIPTPLFNQYQPIGYLESTYTARNFTPNQSTRAPSSRARLRLDINHSKFKEGSFDNFEEFSHCWIIFEFHENTNLTVYQQKQIKGKILPPRKKDNKKVGVFSSRSPHRPNAIGLSLVQISHVDQKGYIYLKSVDLIDGTPVLDVKPYIPSHDNPQNVKIADWVKETSDIDKTDFNDVIIDEQVSEKLKKFEIGPLYEKIDDLLQTLKETLRWDGRKKYSKEANHWIINLSKIDFYCKIYDSKIVCFDVVPYTYPQK